MKNIYCWKYGLKLKENLVEGSHLGRYITQGGQIISGNFNTFYAPVVKGKTYTITTDEKSIIYAYYVNKPEWKDFSYNKAREPFTSKTVVAPIDGYIAFRSTINFTDAVLYEGDETPYTISDKLELLAVVDDYNAFNFTRSYSGCGSWQLSIDGSALNAKRIKGMNFISFDDCAGWVQKVEETVSNTRNVVFSGIELKGITANRIVIPPVGEAYHTINAPADMVLYDLLLKHVISPSDASRAIKGQIINTSGGASTIAYNGRYSNLMEEIETIATANGLGWNATIEESEIVWKIYKGVNRTAAQSENDRMIFDYNYGLIDSSGLTLSDNIPNFAIVAGQGEGSERATHIIDNGSVGIDRVEVFFDARDIEDDTQLPQRGLEKLAEFSDDVNYSCELSQQGIKQYRNLFDLGDIGSIRDTNFIEGLLDYRITEITEIYENNQLAISLTIGYDKENLKAALKRMKQPTVEKMGGAVPTKTSELTNDSGYITNNVEGTLTVSNSVRAETSISTGGAIFGKYMFVGSNAETWVREDGTVQTKNITLTNDITDETADNNASTVGYVKSKVSGKQDTLTAGDNITIENNVISAEGSSSVVLWEGTQSFDSAFTLSDDCTNYSYLCCILDETIGTPILLAPNAPTFTTAVCSTGNTARMYFAMGTIVWSDNTTFTPNYKLRFYKTSATAGGSSTVSITVKKIIGIK